jgi:ribonuclease P protein component
MREAHVPAQHPKAQQASRLSPPDEHSRRSGNPEVPPSAGPRTNLRLIEPVRDRAIFATLARARPRRSGPVSIRQVRFDDGGIPQVAYAVGKRTGNAVTRNRARRRLRAAVRAVAPDLAPGHAYLVSAGPDAVTAPFVDLQRAVTTVLVAPEPSP